MSTEVLRCSIRLQCGAAAELSAVFLALRVFEDLVAPPIFSDGFDIEFTADQHPGSAFVTFVKDLEVTFQALAIRDRLTGL